MRGVPMGLIAEQLGHADTRMTEKHYAHLAPSYVADTIRAHFPTLGIAEESTVTPIWGKDPAFVAAERRRQAYTTRFRGAVQLDFCDRCCLSSGPAFSLGLPLGHRR
jgi:hypothetical protein